MLEGIGLGCIQATSNKVKRGHHMSQEIYPVPASVKGAALIDEAKYNELFENFLNNNF